MPDSNLADNSVLTSTFYNTYIREQVVVTCTSATRPTGVEGRLIYETDTNRLMVYDGANWKQVSNDSVGETLVAGGTQATTTAGGDITITFGVTFASAPIVVAVPQYSTTSDTTLHFPSAATTTTQVARIAVNGSVLVSTSCTVKWMAFGTLV